MGDKRKVGIPVVEGACEILLCLLLIFSVKQGDKSSGDCEAGNGGVRGLRRKKEMVH